ncbi:unnamed protein product [Auanema sp. JU1783]|nr:unnamed protein product [Auanema sp. JU1783]
MSAFNMGTMVHHEGWLTRLRDSGWLIAPLQSRWIKRFFVLRSEGFAETKRYFLDEFKEESKKTLIKTHDLDRCEQVESHLQLSDSSCINSFAVFKWIFSIHLSKPHSLKRSEVIFVAKDEIEMGDWVRKICRFCHLEKRTGTSHHNPYSCNENDVPQLFNDMSVSSDHSIDSFLDGPLSDVTSESRTGTKNPMRNMTFFQMKNLSRMGHRNAAIELRPLQSKKSAGSRHNRTCSSASGCSLSSSHQSGTTEDDASSVHSARSAANGVPTVPPRLSRKLLKKQMSSASSATGTKLSEAGSTAFSPLLTNGLGSGETIKASSCNLSLTRNNLGLASPIKGSYPTLSLSTSCLTYPTINDADAPPVDRTKKPPNLRIDLEEGRTCGSMLNTPISKMPVPRKKTMEHPKSAGLIPSRKDLDYFEPLSSSVTLERNAKSEDAQRSSDLQYITIDSTATQNLKTIALNRGNGDNNTSTGRSSPAASSEMCGMMQSGLCRFSELTPGQFGLTKQLVLRLALPHVTLLLVSIIYAAFGGWILTVIKYSDQSTQEPDLLEKTKGNFTKYLVSLIGSSRNTSRVEKRFSTYVTDIHNIYQGSPYAWSSNNTEVGDIIYPLSNVTWNLFFAATTLTSIGYGTDAPDSSAGRLFCLLYLFFGIPLYLITLADLAKFCTEFMNRTYTEVLKCKFHIRRKFKRWRAGRLRRDSVRIGQVIIAGGEDEVAEFLWTHLEHAQFVEVPFVLVIGILLAYIALSSYIIASVENWTTSDGFYFVMMSVLTIGFGDLVPRNDAFILLVLILILIGLVLTTTCVDVVGAYYIDRLHFFGRRLDDDPLSWLKAVQQKRIEAMKREAMRKLFETVTALHHIRFTTFKHLTTYETFEDPNLSPPPESPRNLVASNATADSVFLRWKPPVYVEEGKRYWYTLTFKTRTPQRRCNVVVVDFINAEKYLVTGLKSFTLYEFSVSTTTRYGSSKPARTQEYTEPCTVPQSVRLDAVSSETATISWRPPKMNNGPESYVIQFAQEPAPQFPYWNRYKVGQSTRFTLTDLLPGTRYIICVSAEHNYGLAAMSKSIRFRTRKWWGDEDSNYLQVPSQYGESGLQEDYVSTV